MYVSVLQKEEQWKHNLLPDKLIHSCNCEINVRKKVEG